MLALNGSKPHLLPFICAKRPPDLAFRRPVRFNLDSSAWPRRGGTGAKRWGGAEREPDRAKHQELFKVPRSGSLPMLAKRTLLIGTVRLRTDINVSPYRAHAPRRPSPRYARASPPY